jgi:cysteate synthase
MTPGAVAAASLLQAVDAGEVDKDDCILLNMSGGGVARLKKDISTRVVKPWLSVKKATGVSAVLDKLGTE